MATSVFHDYAHRAQRSFTNAMQRVRPQPKRKRFDLVNALRGAAYAAAMLLLAAATAWIVMHIGITLWMLGAFGG